MVVVVVVQPAETHTTEIVAALVVQAAVHQDCTPTAVDPVSLEAAAATDMAAQVHRLLVSVMEQAAAVAMVDLGAVLVQAVLGAPLGPVVLTEAQCLRLVPHHPGVEVQATVPAVAVVGGMEEGPRLAEIQATPAVVLRGAMDRTAAVAEGGALRQDVEVDRGDIQVHPVQATLHRKAAEGGIHTVPRHHSHPLVALAMDMIPRVGPLID